MNEPIACSDYDDGICRPTGDVCPLQIEDQHRCVNKRLTGSDLPNEEWFKDKILANYPCLDPEEDDIEWAENLGQWLRAALIEYPQERRKEETMGEQYDCGCCRFFGDCQHHQPYSSTGATVTNWTLCARLDAAEAEAVKRVTKEYRGEVFPGLIPEEECWKRIDDAVKAEGKRIVKELDRHHTSSTEWLTLREKLIGPEEASNENG